VLFYSPDISETSQLPEEEASHALRVLRLPTGAIINVTDGKGHLYKARLENTAVKNCHISIIEQWTPDPTPYNIHIAIAPTKNIDRMEWFCEKTTEIGISTITFLLCRHSERRDIKLPRIEKILISAMKQSQKAILPKLNPLIDFSSFITSPFHGHKYIAHCEKGEKQLLKSCYPAGSDALILIGPEGDFSNEEISAAINHGFLPISLGTSRLRTETAGIAACHSIHILN
jgi:16S rRNA (uracil1498-N3)-methyltransferase